MPRVVLKKQAFISMVIASLEVYRKESFGILLGKRKNGNVFVVDNAVPFQSASRDYEYVSIDCKQDKRVGSGLRFLSGDEVIGDYHSHAEFPEALSFHDRKELLEAAENSDKEYIALLVVARRSNGYRFWSQNIDRSISGSIGLKWLVKIRAFKVKEGTKNIAVLGIKCDYMQKLNTYLAHYRTAKQKLSKIEREHKRKIVQKKRIRSALKKYFS